MRDMQIKRFDHSEYRTFARPITGVLGFALLGLALMSLGLIAALVAPQESVAQSNNPDAMPLGVFASGADHVLINGTRALPGTEIFAGDEVTTNASGRAQLTFINASMLHLAGNSSVQVVKIAPAAGSWDEVLILDFAQGVGRMDAGETVLIRGGGGGAFIEGGTLDMVSSNSRLVTVMRRGTSQCRAASGITLTMTDEQRACILARGTIRPSMLSAAMKRVIDERLSIPPSTRALSQNGAEAGANDYGVNQLTNLGRENTALAPIVEPLPSEGQTQSQLLRQFRADER